MERKERVRGCWKGGRGLEGGEREWERVRGGGRDGDGEEGDGESEMERREREKETEGNVSQLGSESVSQ